ncbi:tetratricopeptide repeat protein [Lunatibacter salilacus]|uniref:tetratricopeptide repeat protein n=1 Tax=Lunatibacter salilacus TaxID=2483804 RepID=UPI00131E246D|nr:tetratricopeptide repeat protein [Lunatibacter salilacus]
MMLFARTLVVVFLLIPTSWKKIGAKNSAIYEAEQAYIATDFEQSVRQHLGLIADHELRTPEVKFNLALSYQNNGQEEEAKKTYEEVIRSENKTLASFSANQVGVLEGRENNHKDALAYFKSALIQNPDNEMARYNYELLSRWLEENEEEKDKEEKDQEDQDKIEPSNYAKRMKAKADEFVDQYRFDEALETMQRALEIDETVAYYQNFIQYLSDVKEINDK